MSTCSLVPAACWVQASIDEAIEQAVERELAAQKAAGKKSEQLDWAAAINAVTCTLLTVMTYCKLGDVAAATPPWLAPIVAAVGGAFFSECLTLTSDLHDHHGMPKQNCQYVKSSYLLHAFSRRILLYHEEKECAPHCNFSPGTIVRCCFMTHAPD